MQLKNKRILVRLTSEQTQLMKELMKEKLETNASAFFASLLVQTRDCGLYHGKNKVGRPRNQDDENPPFVVPDRPDTLSFTPEELAQVKAKTLKNQKRGV